MDENLSRILECSVCLDKLAISNNKSLPCTHTFHLTCLNDILNKHKELRCPECRILVTVRPESLPTNVTVNRILEAACFVTTSKPAEEGHAPKCDPSPRGDASRVSKLPSVPCARAIYPYHSRDRNDLNFEADDILVLQKQVDLNWYEGRLNSKVGVFPANYVTVLNPLPKSTPLTCTAQHDFHYDDGDTDCLKFDKGNVITVLKRVDNNWLEGRIGDRVGIFPLVFVKMDNTSYNVPDKRHSLGDIPSHDSKSPLDKLSADMDNVHLSSSSGQFTSAGISESNRQTSMKPSNVPVLPAHSVVHKVSNGSKRTYRSNTTISEMHNSASPEICDTNITPASHPSRTEVSGIAGILHPVDFPSFSGAVAPPLARRLKGRPVSVTMDSNLVSDNANNTTPFVTHYPHRWHKRDPDRNKELSVVSKATYNYLPKNYNELELKKGDLYVVQEQCKDGWLKGTSIKSGLTGVFPSIYVSVASQETNASNDRSSNKTPFAVTNYQPHPHSDKAHVDLSGVQFSIGESTPNKSCKSSAGFQFFKSRKNNGVKKKLRKAGPAASVSPAVTTTGPSTGEERVSVHSRVNLDSQHVIPVERFRVVTPYPAQTDEEIELLVGDIVHVIKRHPGGWCRGKLQRTGKVGLFPGNFVEPFI